MFLPLLLIQFRFIHILLNHNNCHLKAPHSDFSLLKDTSGLFQLGVFHIKTFIVALGLCMFGFRLKKLGNKEFNEL